MLFPHAFYQHGAAKGHSQEGKSGFKPVFGSKKEQIPKTLAFSLDFSIIIDAGFDQL
jgi:hypothetical protein